MICVIVAVLVGGSPVLAGKETLDKAALNKNQVDRVHGEAVLEALLKGREQLLLDHPRHFILLLVCRLSMD